MAVSPPWHPIPGGITAPSPRCRCWGFGCISYQQLRFGRLAGITAVKGLSRQSCPVLIAQSDDDRILPYKKNYMVLYRRFHADPRFTFLPLTGHNHNITTPHEVDLQKLKLLKVLRGPNPLQDATHEINRLKTITDEDLLGKFTDFFDRCLKQA